MFCTGAIAFFFNIFISSCTIIFFSHFIDTLQKNLILPSRGTVGISFFRKSFFINECTFWKILNSQKFWQSQYQWICSYLRVKMSLRKNGTNTFRKLSRNVLHIRIGCLRHLGNQIVAKHMTQTRTRSQTHDLLCGYP